MSFADKLRRQASQISFAMGGPVTVGRSNYAQNPAEAVRHFIAESLLFTSGNLPFGDEESLLDAGVVDSTGILQLQLFVEEAFGIEVRDEDVVPENFDSVASLVAYVERKRSASKPVYAGAR